MRVHLRTVRAALVPRDKERILSCLLTASHPTSVQQDGGKAGFVAKRVFFPCHIVVSPVSYLQDPLIV